MVRNKSKFSNKWDIDYNVSLFVMLVIAVIVNAYLMIKGVFAGTVYTIMFLVFVAMISLMRLFFQDDMKLILQYVKLPFSTSQSLANFFYLLGFITPILLKLVLNVIAKLPFDIVELSIPVFGQSLDQGIQQTFSASQFAGSLPWRIFVTMYSAGTTETFGYSVVAVLVGVVFALWLFKQVNDDKAKPSKALVFTISFAFSVLVFIASHILNDNYVGIAFLFAGLFLLISNASIYMVGVFIMYWVGYHQSHNLLWMIGKEGLGVVLSQGFLSWFGAFFVIFIALTIWNVIINFPSIKERLRSWRRLREGV